MLWERVPVSSPDFLCTLSCSVGHLSQDIGVVLAGVGGRLLVHITGGGGALTCTRGNETCSLEGRRVGFQVEELNFPSTFISYISREKTLFDSSFCASAVVEFFLFFALFYIQNLH